MDKADVRDLIETYMFGVDAKDLEALLSCFAPEAEALYHKGTVDEKAVIGGAAIAHGVFESCSRFSASNHSISNVVVQVEGDRARANTFAVAHVIVAEKGLVRGLRYEDVLMRGDSGWTIHSRVHTPLWQTEIVAGTPRFFQ